MHNRGQRWGYDKSDKLGTHAAMRVCPNFEHCGMGLKPGATLCVACKPVRRRPMTSPCLLCSKQTSTEVVLCCGHVVCSTCASHTLGTSNATFMGVHPPYIKASFTVPSPCMACGLNDCICEAAVWMSPSQTLRNFFMRDLPKGACLLCRPPDAHEQLVPRTGDVWA